MTAHLAQESPITPQLVAAAAVSLSEPSICEGVLHWLETRPAQGGRVTLLRNTAAGTAEMTPEPYSVRSRVHEYGGGAYLPVAEGTYFVNNQDQNIYFAAEDGAIRQITHSSPAVRYADLCLDAGRRRLIAVTEIHPQSEEPVDAETGQEPDQAPIAEPENALATIALDGGKAALLHQGHDFYAAPRLSADGGELLFVAWDHPNMPWDGALLQRCRLAARASQRTAAGNPAAPLPLEDGAIAEAAIVAGGIQESVMQPSWTPDGAILYLSDQTGFWNIHRLDDAGAGPLLRDEADYGDPPWQFGQRSYVCLNERLIVARRRKEGRQELVLLDQANGASSPLADNYAAYGHLSAQDDSLYCAAAHTDSFTVCLSINLRTQAQAVLAQPPPIPQGGGNASPVDEEPWSQASGGKTSRISQRSAGAHAEKSPKEPADATASPLAGMESWLSSPEHVAYPTRDGGCAYAYLYRPNHPALQQGGRSPLMLLCHGGPTGSASPSLNLLVQFYTSRGWMVVDVDYRGSAGYGRAYRDALNGRWGELDVTDCEDAVQHLVAQGEADPARVAIRGRSAGGYTTLRALTTSRVFRAGASHYGIGDLEALAQDTHKFEARYLDGLLGTANALQRRSPIHYIDGLNCPVIFFQGGKDRIVPPNQAQAMVAALRRKGLPVAYVEFPDEGHGFRDGRNIAHCIGAECVFFCRVFGLPQPNGLPKVEIENL